MVTRTTDAAPKRLTTPAQVLLRRRGIVYPPTAPTDAPNSATLPGVDLLEADLLDRGWLLSPALRHRLACLDPTDLAGVGATLLADCDMLLGADRPHVPLLRLFPTSTPANTLTFFVDRVLAVWFQLADQPCVLCGAATGSVNPVNPCGHLVCGSCFDGADFSACPICHRRIDVMDPYLAAAAPRPRATAVADPQRLRVLHPGTDLDADNHTELAALLARPAALPPADVDDLAILLAFADRADLSWIPDRVPGRETKARLLAWLLDEPSASTDDVADRLVDTATDILRVLVLRSGGASLVDRPRIGPVPRPLRRHLLALLDRIAPVQLVEDMRRHRGAWIAVGERLHPFEYARRYPSVAVAFAALRGTDLIAHPTGHQVAIRAEASTGIARVGGRVVADVPVRRIEMALARGDVRTAVDVLAARPGDLLRRADHLLRSADGAEGRRRVVTAIAAAARRVSPALLLSTLGEIRVRADRRGQRVFFPAGRTSTAHVIDDARPLLPPDTVAATVEALEAEVARRATALPRVETAVVDAGLDGLVAPFAERTAARALVTLARGSVQGVPDGRHLRLFCHWMESDQRVDLDLSVALFDPAWSHVGTCDYTSLRVPGAVHSGDLTSAPAPLGASEFIDLDVDRLRASGARYAMMVVLSYNNVRFTDMADAFAGVMARAATPDSGPVFDARAVEQKFDLTGPGRVTIPFVVDLDARTMRWLDVNAAVTGTDHAIHRHHGQLALVGQVLTETFAAGTRVTLGELARWHAAARADRVVIHEGGSLWEMVRDARESVVDFAVRLRDRSGGRAVTEPPEAALQFVVRGDLPTPDGAEVYALHPAGLDAGRVRLLAAAEVAAMLDPVF